MIQTLYQRLPTSLPASVTIPIPQSLPFRLPRLRSVLLFVVLVAALVVSTIHYLHSLAVVPQPPVRSLLTDRVWDRDDGGVFQQTLARLEGDLRRFWEDRGIPYNGTVYPSTLTPDQLLRFDHLRAIDHPAKIPGSSSLSSPFSSLTSSPPSTSSPSPKGKLLIALNFFQTAALLPDFLATIANLIHFLGPSRLVFSVLEGPSTDGTPDVLADIMLPLLLQLGVPAESIHFRLNWPRKKWEWRNRIEALAELRNEVLEPLWLAPPPEGWEAIVFMNVYTSAAHILELLHLHLLGEAGITCAWDTFYYPGTFWNRPRESFYDAWVARTHSSGDTFYPWSSTFSLSNLFYSSPPERARYELGVPLQVMSCWNGIAVLDPRPFLLPGTGPSLPSSTAARGRKAKAQAEGTWGREQETRAKEIGVETEEEVKKEGSAVGKVPPVRFRRGYVGEEEECSQSECFLVCRDFWKWGLGRVQIVPTVRVGYILPMARWLAGERMEIGIRRDERGRVLKDGREMRVDWEEAPPDKVVCYPWPDRPGLKEDPWLETPVWVDSLTG